MMKTNQQEMLEVLTNMSAVAAEILQSRNHEAKANEEDVKNLLMQLKAAYCAE